MCWKIYALHNCGTNTIARTFSLHVFFPFSCAASEDFPLAVDVMLFFSPPIDCQSALLVRRRFHEVICTVLIQRCAMLIERKLPQITVARMINKLEKNDVKMLLKCKQLNNK